MRLQIERFNQRIPENGDVVMGVTRISVDEVKKRMDAGEDFFFLDTRNPKAWAEADTRLPQANSRPCG